MIFPFFAALYINVTLLDICKQNLVIKKKKKNLNFQ